MDGIQPKEALDRASRCVDEEKLGEAAELCAAVLRSAPRNARAFYIRAAVLRKEGKRKEAVEAACQAAGLRPDRPSVVLAAGSLLCREKCFARALTIYETALEEDPGNARYHLGAASALRKLGRSEEATTALLKAAAAASATPAGGGNATDVQLQAQVQYKLGQHLRSTGDPASCALAAEAYGRCLDLDPGHTLAGFWLMATRKLADARGGGVTASSQHSDNDISRADDAAGAGHPPDLAPGDPPTAAPREYVVGLYNAYAETFDSHLQEALEYRTPAVIVESLAAVFPGRRYKRCLDLGCGTGLSGQAASSVCGSLVGVDLSPAMVARAKEKRLYRRVLVGDVTETVERLCRESSDASAAAGAAGSGAGIRRPRGWEVPAAREEEGGATAVAGAAAGEDGRQRSPTAQPAAERAGRAAAVRREGEIKPVLDGVALPSRDESSGDRERGELVMSCDVFGYIGNLRPCFKAVNELVTGDGSLVAEPPEPGAIFAFSAEAPPATRSTKSAGGHAGRGAISGSEQPGYELQGTGRYTHRREYLEAVCRDTGFRVLLCKEVVLRKNAGVPVRGFVIVTEAVLL
eukprot:g2543.t1